MTKLAFWPDGIALMCLWIERLFKDSRRLSSALRMLLICCLSLVLTQSAPAAPAGNTCNVAKDTKGAFSRASIPGAYIAARFIDKPRSDAGVDVVRRHFVYEAILGRIASLRLRSATSRSCNFAYDLDGSLDLYFQPLDLTERGLDECDLSKCAVSLAHLLQSMTVERSAFSQVTAEGVQSMQENDNKAPTLTGGRRRATLEAYRRIYASGTNAHTFLSLGAEDFGSADYNDFQRWFGHQQALLQQHDEKASGGHDPRPEMDQPSQDRPAGCQKTEIKVRELDINHHGWGHRSILLVNHGYHGNGAAGIGNSVLRAFCPPHAGSAEILSSGLWLEMADRISCSRERVDADRWLVMAAKERPMVTPVEMKRYAQGVAEVLDGQECVHPNLEMILVNFLPQK